MFGKKCQYCGKKIREGYEFCPNCGKHLKFKHDKEDYGFLGKSDFNEEETFLGINDTFLDKIMNSAMRLLEKQMRNFQNEIQGEHKPRVSERHHDSFNNPLNVQFFVNGKRVFPEKINPTNRSNNRPIRIRNRISPEKIKKFAELPKVEPLSNLRRISGKIIYELETPGVENIDDILINKLENSIEIKALSRDKVYAKNINLNLPILNYYLNKGSLILELQNLSQN